MKTRYKIARLSILVFIMMFLGLATLSHKIGIVYAIATLLISLSIFSFLSISSDFWFDEKRKPIKPIGLKMSSFINTLWIPGVLYFSTIFISVYIFIFEKNNMNINDLLVLIFTPLFLIISSVSTYITEWKFTRKIFTKAV